MDIRRISAFHRPIFAPVRPGPSGVGMLPPAVKHGRIADTHGRQDGPAIIEPCTATAHPAPQCLASTVQNVSAAIPSGASTSLSSASHLAERGGDAPAPEEGAGARGG